MQKFHVTPITPKSEFLKLKGRNVLISYLRNENYKQAVSLCQKIYIDNGAYTFFRKGLKPNWNNFYKWLEGKTYNHFFIPDVIDGSEIENNNLINLNDKLDLQRKGIPVFHLHESNKRLKDLIQRFDYIALGSSGEFWELGTDKWFFRMNELMKILCDDTGKPRVKIHMLRCLNPKIFTLFPFYSGDSSNLARNHHIRGIENILNELEKHNSPEKYQFKDIYLQLSILDYIKNLERV